MKDSIILRLLGKNEFLIIKHKIDKKIAESSKISSFCDKSSRNWVTVAVETVAVPLSAGLINYEIGIIIEYWVSMMNNIPINFNKRPSKILLTIEKLFKKQGIKMVVRKDFKSTNVRAVRSLSIWG